VGTVSQAPRDPECLARLIADSSFRKESEEIKIFEKKIKKKKEKNGLLEKTPSGEGI
jgi:uncharacterized protein HemY